jgi:hypothetical protein
VYFLVAHLMLGVESRECESGLKDYFTPQCDSVLDSQEQTSEVATTRDCVGT